MKAAYLAYWKMVDRLIAAPDPSDPELTQRATDPLLASLRDDLGTRQTQGRVTRPPANSRYAHNVESVELNDGAATVRDCFIDDRVQYASDGSVVNDRVSTVRATAMLTLADDWKVSDVRTERLGDGTVGCG